MRIGVRIVVLLSVILISGCNCTPKTQPVRTASTSVSAEDYFFPQGILYPTRSNVDKSVRDWYSKYLRAMQEPSLSSGTQAADSIYRFLWLRSFHHPIAVRVEITGSASVLYAVELDHTGGGAAGKVSKQVQRALSPAEQKKLTAKLRNAGLWQMPTPGGGGGFDGAEWILEGVRNGQYHVVNRWSPESGAYRNVCLLFIRLAGFSIPSEEIY